MARPRQPQVQGPTLFESSTREGSVSGVPLAERVRPRDLRDLVGQHQLLAKDSALVRAIQQDRLRSAILWGPPGSGKTTLARVVAETSHAEFVALNAVLAGVGELRQVVHNARQARAYQGKRTILFVDEIHRFHKGQQDALLPHVEDGTVILIGATTENPSFAVVPPLLSRCKVYRLDPLDEAALVEVLTRAAASPAGLGGRFRIEPAVLEALARGSQGDARRALTSLETVSDDATLRGTTEVTLTDLERIGEHRTLRHDKSGEDHYNVTSAFIKSLRGSDPDAAIYYFMRMMEAGDDPSFVLRRMIIFASEDVGNADPRALEIAVAADAAFRRVGLPEGLFPMAQAVLYLATAPKSNRAMLAWQAAQQVVREFGALEVPFELRNATSALMKQAGYAAGYRYPHDEATGFVPSARYLPDAISDRRFYEPSNRGYERTISERLRWLRGQAEGSADDSTQSPPTPGDPKRESSS